MTLASGVTVDWRNVFVRWLSYGENVSHLAGILIVRETF